MANRHKNRARGGKAYTCSAGGNKNVLAEAKQRQDGGEVKVTGRAAGGRLDRARGGAARPPVLTDGVGGGSGDRAWSKKRGGSVGKSPFSSAGGGSADKSPFFK